MPMLNFATYFMARRTVHPLVVLRKMLATGKFYASADWARQGNGLDIHRFNAVWKAVVEPDQIGLSDVELIFCTPFSRYTKTSAPAHAYDLNENAPDDEDG